MIGALIFLHRWLGVAFCSTPSEARVTSGIGNTARVRLTQRIDGPIYLISSSSGTIALQATDLTEAAVKSAELARAIASDFAIGRQWALPRSASPRGKTTINYAGSVTHWIYITAFRLHAVAWNRLLWWLSLLALIEAALGACVGILRIKVRGIAPCLALSGDSMRGIIGSVSAACCSCWLGYSVAFCRWTTARCFSTDKPSDKEIAALAGAPDWNAMPRGEAQSLDPQVIEAEMVRLWRPHLSAAVICAW